MWDPHRLSVRHSDVEIPTTSSTSWFKVDLYGVRNSHLIGFSVLQGALPSSRLSWSPFVTIVKTLGRFVTLIKALECFVTLVKTLRWFVIISKTFRYIVVIVKSSYSCKHCQDLKLTRPPIFVVQALTRNRRQSCRQESRVEWQVDTLVFTWLHSENSEI